MFSLCFHFLTKTFRWFFWFRRRPGDCLPRPPGDFEAAWVFFVFISACSSTQIRFLSRRNSTKWNWIFDKERRLVCKWRHFGWMVGKFSSSFLNAAVAFWRDLKFDCWLETWSDSEGRSQEMFGLPARRSELEISFKSFTIHIIYYSPKYLSREPATRDQKNKNKKFIALKTLLLTRKYQFILENGSRKSTASRTWWGGY